MKEQFLVCVQHKHQEKNGEFYNLAKLMHGFNTMYYKTLEEAKTDLNKYITEHNNRKPGIETTKVGCIGVDFEVDQQLIDDNKVIHYYIKKRFVTPFEEVERT